MGICPAQAGVILREGQPQKLTPNLSRASGGDPMSYSTTFNPYIFVPRKRG